MRQLNISIDDKAYREAKAAAEEAGMLLRKWVERAILRQSQAEQPAKGGSHERTYQPIDTP